MVCTGEKSCLGAGLGSFSKASFVAVTDGGGKDVDLDDPDFWKKTIDRPNCRGTGGHYRDA
jgi:hypothetical protein